MKIKAWVKVQKLNLESKLETFLYVKQEGLFFI